MSDLEAVPAGAGETLRLEVQSSQRPRLDAYLLGVFPWRSRTQLQALIRCGRVLLNGARTRPAFRVARGDIISISGLRAPAEDRSPPPGELEVLYEDPWLLVVNKPPGLVVHPVGQTQHNTLIGQIQRRFGPGGASPKLCHRVDKDTTGVVLVGLDAHVHRAARWQFEARIVTKEYIALAEGTYPSEGGAIELPLGEGRCLETCLGTEPLRPARTDVAVIGRYAGHTLLSCQPRTGRLNQIRVHLAAEGHPIAGDVRFGGSPQPTGFPDRYLLHSSRLRFYHPRLKSRMSIAAPLPRDFQALLDTLSSDSGLCR